MSHFIEANIYWIVAIVNLIPVLLFSLVCYVWKNKK